MKMFSLLNMSENKFALIETHNDEGSFFSSPFNNKYTQFMETGER